jgi:hypothetical protein
MGVLLCYVGLLAWVWVERGRRATLWPSLAALSGCLLLLHAGAFFRKETTVPSATIFDLRRGRAALIATAHTAVLIDAGGASDAQALSDLLRRLRPGGLQLLVISEDEAEAIGGARELISRVRVAQVILPRSGSASTERRELERLLARKGIPYGTPWDAALGDAPRARQRSAVVRVCLGGLNLAFCDDGPPPSRPAPTGSALCTRIELPSVALLFASVRSGAALRRLLSKCGQAGEGEEDGEFLKAGVLRLSGGAGAGWPAETGELLAQSGCKTVIAGQTSGPEEAAGWDLAKLAAGVDAMLLSPHRDGSLRIISTGLPASGYVLQAFTGGEWHEAAEGLYR